jgi:hypothetical protein
MATGKKKRGEHWRENRRHDVNVKVEDPEDARKKLAMLVRSSSLSKGLAAITATGLAVEVYHIAHGFKVNLWTKHNEAHRQFENHGVATTIEAALERAVTAYAEGEKKA